MRCAGVKNLPSGLNPFRHMVVAALNAFRFDALTYTLPERVPGLGLMLQNAAEPPLGRGMRVITGGARDRSTTNTFVLLTKMTLCKTISTTGGNKQIQPVARKRSVGKIEEQLVDCACLWNLVIRADLARERSQLDQQPLSSARVVVIKPNRIVGCIVLRR